MIHTLRLSFLVVLALLPFRLHADLPADINSVLRDKLLTKATVGIRVISMTDQSVIYEHDAATPLMPASNMKVLTTSAALDGLGADFKFQTLLVRRGNDLAIIGDGDPTLGDAELLKKVGWDTTTVFKNWADQLKKANLTQFDNVLVDDSVFDQTFAHPHWPPEQLHNRFSAEIAGLTLNAGAIDFYVTPTTPGKPVAYHTNPPTRYVTVQNTCNSGGSNNIILDRKLRTNQIILAGSSPVANSVPASVSVHDPALYAATVLSETLQSAGIHITGKVIRDRTLRNAIAQSDAAAHFQLLAIHETPIAQVLARANKDSMNQYAEALCKRLGYNKVTGEAGSWQNGPAAVARFLTEKCGADPRQFHLDDGCGLSRQDNVSATVMSQVLTYDFMSPNKSAFFDSLAISGVDGTLDDRFRERGLTQLRQRVHAKSGYIVGVCSLSGYLKTRDGHFYAFSILMNGIPRGANGRAKELQELILKAVDDSAAK